MKRDLSFAQVDELLTYDASTGKLYWKPRSPLLFDGSKIPQERCAKIWNSKHAGKEAFTKVGRDGRRYGRIYGEAYLAHRVIWLLVTGEWPKYTIDHINGDASDNRMENLRDVEHVLNMQNMKLSKSNTSGVSGVYWKPETSKWISTIKHRSKYYYIGSYSSLEDAERATLAKRAALGGFTDRHGKRGATP